MKNYLTQTALIILLIAAVHINKANSQNLVPNPGFETISSCPPQFNNSITYCPPWMIANNGGGLTYNLTCPPPLNVPPRSGNGCGGLFHKLSLPEQRGYIEAPLSSALISGQQYCVSYWLRLLGTMKWAVNRSGAYFSVGAIYVSNLLPLPYTPQIQHPSSVFLTDTLGWMQIAGTFTASGGETHMIIGNFYNESQTGIQLVNANGIDASFYFIDDVSVTAVTTPCTVGLEENVINSSEIKVIPNPASNFTTIVVPDLLEVTAVKLFDITGKILEELRLNSISKNEITLDVSKYPTGLYAIEITTNKGVVNNKMTVIK